MNVKGVEGTVNVDADTLYVTGMTSGLLFAPADAIWMLPFSVPAERPVVLTEMVKLAGRLPLVGAAMLSHEFPDATDAVTLAVLAGDDPMFKVCEAGAAASPSV